jgi:hypothetical protein
MRRSRAVLACAATSLAVTGLVLGGTTPSQAVKPPSGSSTGVGRIFMVNPVQSSGNEGLTDQKDSATSVPASEYTDAQLRNLDGSGHLVGKWVTVRSSTGTPAYSPTNTFLFNRHDDQFEQVMAYFWINQSEEYLQSLGFGSTLPPILKRSYPVLINQFGGDNSFEDDVKGRIRYGKGGVDDAEDAEVIVHEYGHAVQADQVPGFGTGLDAGSIGEAFGDYLGVSVGLAAAKQYGWPVRAEEACTNAPHCIRRFDTNLTVKTREGEVHADGQIWSQALWEIRKDYVALGKTTKAWDTTLIDAQFGFTPDTTFSAAAKKTYAKALTRDGAAAAAAVKQRFKDRGITF